MEVSLLTDMLTAAAAQPDLNDSGMWVCVCVPLFPRGRGERGGGDSTLLTVLQCVAVCCSVLQCAT